MCWVQTLDEEHNASSDTAGISTDLKLDFLNQVCPHFHEFKLPNFLKLLAD